MNCRRGCVWTGGIFSAALAGCAGPHQSALNPAGPQAARIADLWWLFLAVLSLIFVLVIFTMAWALTRRHDEGDQESGELTRPPAGGTEQKLTRNVLAATIATIVILLLLLVLSVSTGDAVANMRWQKNGLAIEVTGVQWWWAVRYLNDDPSRILVTANEIHIPVGRPVMIRGTSQDVIHSFWVPGLHGKRDLIPSHVTAEWIQADRPGRFRGQCAEFCGIQHAHMALWVVAEPEAQFEAWMQHQLQPSVAPSDLNRQLGQKVFMNHACVYCHSISGTSAAGQSGPDLTHLGSRLTLAAGTLPNTKGNLGGWILDPQTLKPGNHMAVVNLRPEEVQPLLDYLESLQ